MKQNPTWIFFDCFNTLVDDFDSSGDETGVRPIAHLPVEAGFYESPEDFRQDYSAWRRRRWAGDDWSEVQLPERVRAVLLTRAPNRERDVEQVVEKMMNEFGPGYRELLRLTPGVEDMLQRWQGRGRMGVVSNFYLPGWPEAVLTEYGLIEYFQFVLDSSTFGWKKPGPEIYLRALELAEVSPDKAGEVLFVGDNLVHDVQAPQRMGMKALYLDRSAERPSIPAPHGIKSIMNWEQFRPQ